MKTASESFSRKHHQLPFERVFVACVVLFLSPIWILNAAYCLAFGRRVVTEIAQDVFVFGGGWMKRSLLLWSVLKGRLCLVGEPLQEGCDVVAGMGVVSLWGLRKLTGMVAYSQQETQLQQLEMTSVECYELVLRYALCLALYRAPTGRQCRSFEVFGVRIDNVRMAQALEHILSERGVAPCRIGCFVNVNSLNQVYRDSELKSVINRFDHVFADGSGVRLAARSKGVQLKENVNGTDMLLLLCEQLVVQERSLYLLGSAPGVAEQTAGNLQRQFKGLQIVGCHDGYFNKTDCTDLIEDINSSGADVLLVGLGSPVQERWLDENRGKLHVSTALAVGGLFDFFSGRIPRAPLWMRELGMEWVWRLLQEPSAKFHRYVIGNPLFLFRIALSK